MKKVNNKKILIIIPAFNEAGIIFNVISQIKQMSAYDYLVIDDNSYDNTEIILKDNKFNYIKNNQNLGLSKTMKVGMEYALKNNYDACIQFDGDGQHDINTLNKMVDKFNQGYEIVLTSRFLEKKDLKKQNLFKKIAWKIFIFLFKTKSKLNITDPTCGLRLYNKRFMEKYVECEKFEVEPSTILYAIRKMDFRIIEIPTIINERLTGQSSFKSFLKVIKYMNIQIRRMLFTTSFWKYHK